MALVECKECGSQVAESAPTCPKCGVPNPAGQTAHFVLSRKKSLSGTLGSADVFVDGEHEGGIKMGETLSVDVSPGKHDIEVEYRTVAGVISRGGDLRVELGGGQTRSYECGVSAFGAFFFKQGK